MKFICHITFILWFTINSNCQKFSQEQFPFPPQFKTPSPPNGVFGSDKSIYLPPESHTTIPYYSISNGNKLPFHFLPPTATKAPSIYPTPFPMIMSSTMISRRDEEEHEREAEDNNKPRTQHNPPPSFRIKNENQTTMHNEYNQERDMRSIPKNFNYQHPIDRIDMKFSPQVHTATQKTPVNQTPASQRRMIISSEILKNEQGIDQIRRASILGSQLNTVPIPYYSTTEPSIPILRLSNEMDLDGSFSYEALGADQTHYVQHSRMENSGTDKEEQIVEGSYSYVGDNGQTYTVHYVADSNGYRASGDHLPVPPPIPEIIQRAIQYNLAEEAKKPVHLKSWQENEKEYEHGESEKHRYSILPPRNLFTGRTPEAFSFGLAQSSLLQNKIANDDNSQVPVKTSFDFSSDQSNKGKINDGPIAPQITFLASQGAHKPSINTAHQQMSRIFATDKPTLPQLMNYEAVSSDSDQENTNKALWRWQYGLNANGANENQHPNKNSISRSFGEGDDVIINFNNMSPEQYTKIIKSDFLEQNTENSIIHNESQNKDSIKTESTPFLDSSTNDNSYITSAKLKENKDERNDYNNIDITSSKEHQLTATENVMPYTASSDWSKHMENVEYNDKMTYFKNNYVTAIPQSTPSYGYSDRPYESVKLKSQNIHVTTESNSIFTDNHNRNNEEDNYNRNNEEKQTKILGSGTQNSDTSFSSNNVILNHGTNLKFTDFIQNAEKDNFKPIVNVRYEKETAQEDTTTELSPESIIKDNFFLKNLFKEENDNSNKQHEVTEEPMKVYTNKINLEPKFDKVPKLIQYQSKPKNEIQNMIKKPIDMTDVMNYITLKNHFESNKLKSKNKFSNSDKLNQRLERPQMFIPVENNRHEEEDQLEQEESQNYLRIPNNQKQQDLRGYVKSYKVLQRNSNTKTMGQNKEQAMTDTSRLLKAYQTQNLPPLGRAGPSMKSYLPPTYL